MKVNNNLYAGNLNFCKNFSNEVAAQDNTGAESKGSKYASVPLSTLKAYNVSFGKGVKNEEFVPNTDTNELEYHIMPPVVPGISEVAVFDKEGQELGRSAKRDKNGRFVVPLNVFYRKSNEFAETLDIDSVSYYSPGKNEFIYEEKGLVIHPEKLMRVCENKKMHINGKQVDADFDVISEGKVEGKLVRRTADFVTDYNGEEPVVVVLDSPKDFYIISNHVYEEGMPLSPNIKGLLGSTAEYEEDKNQALKTFSHAASRLRNSVVVTYMPQALLEKINKTLNSKEEPLVELNARPVEFDIKRIAQLSPVDKTPIVPPENKMADRILLPEDEDFTQATVGLKAYNLGILRRNAKVGGYIVPEFLAVPAGFLAKIPEPAGLKETVAEIDKTKHPEEALLKLRKSIAAAIVPDAIVNEIVEAYPELFERNMKQRNKCLIARSSFNGEDSARMSTQGLYDSYPGIRNNAMLITYIKQVMASKWSNLAYMSRRNHGIKHQHIQPNVIIQEVVPVDYTFTLYTADARTNDDSKMVIDMTQGVCSSTPGAPYIFEYDKISGKSRRTSLARKDKMMTIENLPNPTLSVLQMQGSDYSRDVFNRTHSEYSPIMNKIFGVAQFIEDTFGGRPQDIEGGIIFERDDEGNVVDADVYIWQTRDAHIRK